MKKKKRGELNLNQKLREKEEEKKQLFDESRESEWFWGNEKQKKQLLGLRDEKEVKMRLSGKGSREEKKAPASTQKNNNNK